MALNQQTLDGNWNTIKGQLRQKWGQLTDDDLEKTQGKADELVGIIQKKTGETRKEVEEFISSATQSSQSAVGSVGAGVSHGVEEAMDRLQGAGEKISDSARDSYQKTESMVRKRPAESLAVCFGAGLFVGVMAGLLLRR